MHARRGAMGRPQNAERCATCPRAILKMPRAADRGEAAATLACPSVSALDRWFASAVQSCARKWFNQPVVEVKQISPIPAAA